jgi:S1-C subfamily serine protease
MILSKQQILGYLTLVGVGTMVGIGAAYWRQPSPPLIASSPAPTQPAAVLNPVTNSPSATTENLNFVAGVVDRVGPAVVRIDALHRLKARAGRSTSGDPDSEQGAERGTGSGFILSADGQIITNGHVVEDTTQVTVTLKDGRILPGNVIGIDPVTDLAVVKVNGQGLPTVKMGDSSNLAAGEWAIAIGNPLGLDNTVTLGIISATGRSSSDVGIPDKRVRYIQADAAINPGNSGGPLLNSQGKVIGINTAIRADGQGLGFAIPIQTAQRIAKQILSTGKASHPYLGIKMVERSPELLKKVAADPQLGAAAKVDQGVIVVEVLPNTPAAKGGLKKGDVIQKVASQKVNSPNDVQEQVESSEIGKPLTLAVIRAGQQQTLQIQPEVYPSTAPEPELEP